MTKNKNELNTELKAAQRVNDTLTKFTGKQQKFIELYCSNYGLKSATWCAIQAGYDRESAHVRASELLDWRKNRKVSLEIESRLAAARDAWEVTRDKHEAELQKIRDAAMEKGQYGVAAKCAELRGRLSGLYIERNLNLNTEISEQELHDKFRKHLDNPREFEEVMRALSAEIYGDKK